MTDHINEISMKIILHAGDARKLIMDALREVEGGQFTDAEQKLVQAKQDIVLAHKAQTETIQKEASGERQEFSLLFAHAQDTLMTVSSEHNIASQLIQLFKSFNARLEELEK
ncbi:aryl-phospho-beta-D-glucosidase BglH domain-containing protein [Listeria floridensis FSL S10-1187]|uniref:Aryl-phospho-beta-D-glucosidase BglH domain-containing protein n=1 Tax=Listeria floridensis FSL S10-1187 TaxID=1265817 RepID=A0ABN0RIE1_9LIST|nr:PTS lactose/cellobiose transporter subunit IIA [Listeria floridensis]EUJ33734.1 aryl-phospho-beta-D-glucosidase BglH domain-containing protein [Listeria floridensis FSL S10-1187]